MVFRTQLLKGLIILQKMKMPKLLCPVILALFFCGTCNDADYGNGAHDLRYNECIEFGNKNYVCFDSIVTDSRCPVDVVCVWAGEAVAGFRLNMSGKQYYIEMKLNSDTLIGDYTLEFENLLPYPNTKIKINPEDYVAEIFLAR